MQYFTKIEDDYRQIKNKAHQAMRDYAKSREREIIDIFSVERFIQDFEEALAQINKDHPRCADVKMWVQKSDGTLLGGIDHCIYVDGNFRLVIYRAKN